MKQEECKILIQEKLDLNSSKVNDRDEIFSEVGPKKRSLSFSGSKGDCFMPQDKQKMSLSMFGDDELAENAFRQETKSFQGGLSNSRSSKRTAGRKIENFTQVTASCFTKQGYDNSALPSPAFEYNPMQ